MGLYLILFGVIVLIVVVIFTWIMFKLLKKDKKENYDPRVTWDFLGALDRIYAKHF